MEASTESPNLQLGYGTRTVEIVDEVRSSRDDARHNTGNVIRYMLREKRIYIPLVIAKLKSGGGLDIELIATRRHARKYGYCRANPSQRVFCHFNELRPCPLPVCNLLYGVFPSFQWLCKYSLCHVALYSQPNHEIQETTE